MFSAGEAKRRYHPLVVVLCKLPFVLVVMFLFGIHSVDNKYLFYQSESGVFQEKTKVNLPEPDR